MPKKNCELSTLPQSAKPGKSDTYPKLPTKGGILHESRKSSQDSGDGKVAKGAL